MSALSTRMSKPARVMGSTGQRREKQTRDLMGAFIQTAETRLPLCLPLRQALGIKGSPSPREDPPAWHPEITGRQGGLGHMGCGPEQSLSTRGSRPAPQGLHWLLPPRVAFKAAPRRS